MDNATRRQILERVKQLGYPDTIEALQNPQVLDQYEQQLQAQSQQQQQQPIQQPEPITFPTSPVTTPNYKVPQPAQSEAKPLVRSFNQIAPQLMKTGGAKQSCSTGYIWSEEQKRCIPNMSVSGYIPQNLDPNTPINKKLEEYNNQGWDINQLAVDAAGAVYPAISRTLNAVGSIDDVVNKNPIGYVGNTMTLIPHPVTKVVGTGLSVLSATPVGRDLNKWILEKPVYHHQPEETPRQSLDRFAVSESTNQPVFVPKNTKKKFDNGGPTNPNGDPKELPFPFGLPLKKHNIYLLPEYNQPINPETGEISPDPQRPSLGMGTNATEYKITAGFDGNDVQIPTIVAGQYIGERGAIERYKLTGERFKTMADPSSYSKFYDQMKQLGLMQEKKYGGIKFDNGGPTNPNGGPTNPNGGPDDQELLRNRYAEIMQGIELQNKQLEAEKLRVSKVIDNVIPTAKKIADGDNFFKDPKWLQTQEGMDYYAYLTADNPQDLEASRKKLSARIKNLLPNDGRYTVAKWDKAANAWSTHNPPTRELYCTPYGCFTYQKAGASDVPLVQGNLGFQSMVGKGTLPFEKVTTPQAGDVGLLIGYSPKDYSNPSLGYTDRAHHAVIYNDTDANNVVSAYNASNGARLNYELGKFPLHPNDPKSDNKRFEYYRYVGQINKMQKALDKSNQELVDIENQINAYRNQPIIRMVPRETSVRFSPPEINPPKSLVNFKPEPLVNFKTGGKKCYTCNSSKLKVVYNKANYKK